MINFPIYPSLIKKVCLNDILYKLLLVSMNFFNFPITILFILIRIKKSYYSLKTYENLIG